MDYREFFQNIGLDEQGCDLFWQLHSRLAEPEFAQAVENCRQAFAQGDAPFLEALLAAAPVAGVRPEELCLFLYLYFCEDTWARYCQLGISRQILWDTMKSLADNCRVTQQNDGICGLHLGVQRTWSRRYLECRLFRLGRLNFELVRSAWEADLPGLKLQPGQPCVKVHISRGERLEDAACEAAYAQAREFFRRYFALEQCVFVCTSWMLDPWWAQVLPSGSGIVRFQQHFHILSVTDNTAFAIGYIFPRGCTDPRQCPQDTTLRRAACQRLLSGGQLGMGLGVRL